MINPSKTGGGESMELFDYEKKHADFASAAGTR